MLRQLILLLLAATASAAWTRKPRPSPPPHAPPSPSSPPQALTATQHATLAAIKAGSLPAVPSDAEATSATQSLYALLYLLSFDLPGRFVFGHEQDLYRGQYAGGVRRAARHRAPIKRAQDSPHRHRSPRV